MRTTLTVADDVLVAVKERARREKRSVGDVLSDLARQALTSQHREAQESEPESFYGFDPFPHRGGVVSNTAIDQLRDEESA
jgi:hypothetical protein